MAHQIETMAYANEVPWHGLGTRVDPTVSIEEMLKSAGLDWEVEMRPMYVKDSNGLIVPVPRKSALVRKSDDRVLTTASHAWKPFQNRDALEFFREYTESGGAHLETAGSLRGGRMIWALAKINKDFRIRGTEDVTKGYILLSSPHEAGYSTKVRTTGTRVVCANTFAVADRDAVAYGQGHLQDFNIQAARESIQLAVDQIAVMEREANLLAETKVSAWDATRFYSRLLQPVNLEEVGMTEDTHVTNLLEGNLARNAPMEGVWESFNNGPGADPTSLWGVFNGITHWADHTAGRNQESRLNSAWFGDRAALKRKAYTQLVEMAS